MKDAEVEAHALGYSIRALSVDGEIMMGTMDMQPKRINVSLNDGVVTSIGKLG